MGDKTGIQWTNATWNPIRGCSRVSEGCRHCYAETMAGRIVAMGRGESTPYDGLVEIRPRRQMQLDANGNPTGKMRNHGTRAYWTGSVAFDPEILAAPLRWKRPRRIFVNSMSDLFHEKLSNEQIAAVFGVMAACPQHTFQVLTKRAKRMREWFGWAGISALDRCAVAADDAIEGVTPTAERAHVFAEGRGAKRWPLPNVWLGVSAENQNAADERIPELLRTPAAVRFISAEPLLGPLDILAFMIQGSHRVCPKCLFSTNRSDPSCPNDGAELGDDPFLGWVIAGCESGSNARPCEVDWLRSLRNQCVEAHVPFFLKQARENPPGREVCQDEIIKGPGSTHKPGGIIGLPFLDGVQWAQFPGDQK